MYYKVRYYVEFLDAGCVENFDTLEEVREWVEEKSYLEITDIELFDDDGYFVSDIEL